MNSSIFKTYILFFSAIVLALAMVSCGESATDPDVNGNNGNDTEEPGPDEVWMVGQSYSPGNLEIEAGTTVTWTNQSSMTHTVTSGSDRTADGTFDSGNLSQGDTFSYTFNEVGEFDYFCIPHENMTATITVIE